MINFLNLQYFLTLSEEMNFHKAAQKLYITQQSLSGHIQKLEEYFAVPLFIRGTPLVLTPAGLHLKEKALQILSMERDLQEEMLGIGGLIGGTLTIGSTHVRTQILLPSVIQAFHERYPSVSIRLFEGNTGDVEQALRDGRIDVSIGFLPSDTTQITSIPLYDENFVAIIPNSVVKRHMPGLLTECQHTSPGSFVLSCLKSCPFLAMTPDTKIGAFNQAYFKKHQITPHIFLETINVGTMLSFCSAGLGMAICPETFTNFSFYDFSRHQIYMLEDSSQTNSIVISHKNTKYQSPTIQAFIVTARQVLSTFSKEK